MTYTHVDVANDWFHGKITDEEMDRLHEEYRPIPYSVVPNPGWIPFAHVLAEFVKTNAALWAQELAEDAGDVSR